MRSPLLVIATGLLGAVATCPVEADEIKGRIKSVTKHSVALEVEKQGVLVFRLDEKTRYQNASGPRELIADEVLVIQYTPGAQGNVAESVSKFIAPLPEGVARITVEELRALIDRKAGGYVLYDSRPPARYHERHIPTAVSLPVPEVERLGEKAFPADKNTLLVFYCGGLSCPLSPKSAQLAHSYGYRQLKVFREGEPGWKKAEYPLESSITFVKTGHHVLVDLRSPEAAEKGHIPRAVNIPVARLADSEKLFPAWKGAPIVFYSDQPADIAKALEQALDWGYRNASAFSGGTAAWVAAGNALNPGKPASRIEFQRKAAEGEIAIADFQTRGGQANVQVVDVRTHSEFGEKRIAGAINIPADEIGRRSGELPAGKDLLLYCSTGTRAEMAYDVLKGKAVKAQYLRAAVNFAADGRPVFEEAE